MQEGWWRSPAAVALVNKYDQVINVVSNASMASLGLSLLFFLAQSYLFQKHPTAAMAAIARESVRVIVIFSVCFNVFFHESLFYFVLHVYSAPCVRRHCWRRSGRRTFC